MTSSRVESGGHGKTAFVTTAVVACLVFATVFPVVAGARAPESSSGPLLPSQETETVNTSVDAGSVSSLSCLDMSKQEVSEKLDRMASERINRLIRRASRKVPDSVRSAMAGERVNLKVGSTYFAAIVDENAQIDRIQTGRLDDPTIRAETDCETLKDIVKSDSKSKALKAALNRDRITFEGVTTSSEVETSYGGKAVQTYNIASSGKTGDTEDAAEGFQSGLTLN